jgi:hypothetical protein
MADLSFIHRGTLLRRCALYLREISGSSEDSTKSYKALSIDHRDNDEAPDLYLLATSAGELTDWAEVPRANPDFMDGYQRQLEKSRLTEIKKFLSTDVNIIPGAILVTVNDEYLDIDEDGDTVQVTINQPPERELKELLMEAYEELYSRLDEHGQEYVDNLSERTEPDDEEQTEDNDEPEQQPLSYLARKTEELKRKVEDFENVSEDEKEGLKGTV